MEKTGTTRDGGAFWDRMGNIACWNTRDGREPLPDRGAGTSSSSPESVAARAWRRLTGRAPASRRTPRRSEPMQMPASALSLARRSRRWLLVLLLFFGLPMLVVVVVVSFFDFDRTDIIPAFILDNYVELFRSEVTLRLYLSSLKFALIVWAITLVHRLHRRLFPGVPRAQPALADRPVPALHGAVLDLEHHPHDLLDPVPRPQRHLQPGADGARRRPASRWSSCCSPTSR